MKLDDRLDNGSLADLYGRPGFLIRRAHQITSALFAEETDDLAITSTQFGMLIALQGGVSIDQASLARLLGLDRSTTGLVVTNLEERGFIERKTDPGDRRRRMLTITPAGEAIRAQAETASRRSQARALEVFNEEDAAAFVRLLGHFVGAFNTSIRTPITDA
jgi:DNA-binding MarR family transcriptional regulator